MQPFNPSLFHENAALICAPLFISSDGHTLPFLLNILINAFSTALASAIFLAFGENFLIGLYR
jgi:hypothetical protein